MNWHPGDETDLFHFQCTNCILIWGNKEWATDRQNTKGGITFFGTVVLHKWRSETQKCGFINDLIG